MEDLSHVLLRYNHIGFNHSWMDAFRFSYVSAVLTEYTCSLRPAFLISLAVSSSTLLMDVEYNRVIILL